MKRSLSNSFNLTNRSDLTNLLLHIEDVKKEQQIYRLCKRLGLSVRKVSASDAGRTVGSLTGLLPQPAVSALDGKTMPASSSPLPDFIVFAGMSSDGLDVFLQQYKEEKIPPTGLKATVTVHNINWSLSRLLEELKREQTAMLLRGQ